MQLFSLDGLQHLVGGKRRNWNISNIFPDIYIKSKNGPGTLWSDAVIMTVVIRSEIEGP